MASSNDKKHTCNATMTISRGRYQGINPSDDVEPVGVKMGGLDSIGG